MSGLERRTLATQADNLLNWPLDIVHLCNNRCVYQDVSPSQRAGSCADTVEARMLTAVRMNLGIGVLVQTHTFERQACIRSPITAYPMDGDGLPSLASMDLSPEH